MGGFLVVPATRGKRHVGLDGCLFFRRVRESLQGFLEVRGTERMAAVGEPAAGDAHSVGPGVGRHAFDVAFRKRILPKDIVLEVDGDPDKGKLWCVGLGRKDDVGRRIDVRYGPASGEAGGDWGWGFPPEK